jgi:Down syndrome cell adhesion molecule
MLNKDTDSEMYEISPYATFSVAGGRTTSSGHAKTPTRGLNASALDYTLQFKTFGHPDAENLNSTAYPLLSGSGFGHVKGKSSWHKQKYYSTDDDSTLSKSMTVVAGSSSARHRNSRDSNNHETRLMSRSSSRQQHPHNGSESDASISPVIDFTSAPTYRIPVKSSKGE